MPNSQTSEYSVTRGLSPQLGNCIDVGSLTPRSIFKCTAPHAAFILVFERAVTGTAIVMVLECTTPDATVILVLECKAITLVSSGASEPVAQRRWLQPGRRVQKRLDL